MRRLKVFEQLILVFLIAVFIPLGVAALIVTNVNQHAVREEIKYSAGLMADSVYQRLITSLEEKKLAVLAISRGLSYIKTPLEMNRYLNEVAASSNYIDKIEIINASDKFISGYKNIYMVISPDIKTNNLILYSKLNSYKYLKVLISLKELENDVFKYIIDNKRQVYVIDSNNKIIIAHNRKDDYFNKFILTSKPAKFQTGVPVIFGNRKNQPNIFLKIKDPNWAIVVTTPKNLTNYGIIKARYKIITVLIVAALVMIIIGATYSYSLNRNIKQLLKTVIAVEKGNYRKRVRLIMGLFTPYEIYFLANELNNMIQQIDNSYNELQSANKQLSKLDEMKSNLIDTVSHEFRTPLTCIKGYASRLLRSDININEDARVKSIKVIKQQTERLSRMVEDLLVIPDIESSMLRIFPEEVNIKEVFEACILSIQQKQTRVINFFCTNNVSTVYADPDRVEQVIINLLDNALKYSPENSEVDVFLSSKENYAVIKIRNDSKPIPEDVLKTLFGKFTRVDDNLTRTTRGTGLGLFIAKGLVEAMGGDISVSSENNFEISFTLPLSAEAVGKKATITTEKAEI